MSDIRKRTGKNGTTYQVRYASTAAKSGYAYATFATRKEAVAFLESGKLLIRSGNAHPEITTMRQAAEWWLKICEKEGLNGREPVTLYTLKNYEYRTRFIVAYEWRKELHELSTPDIVAFRSWLLQSGCSRVLASKVLSTLQSIVKEMNIRGVVPHNVAAGVSIRADPRYEQPVSIPSKAEIAALLAAADRLANSKNAQTARTWERYRPILYLAVDSGMRPQEYLALSRAAVEDHGVHVLRAIDGSGHTLTVTKTSAGRRFIELSDDTIAMIRHYAAHHSAPNEHDLVFPAANGSWMCRKNWQRRGFNAACFEAGLVIPGDDGTDLPKYRPYDLRHFFASMLIERKVNLKKIQTLMGHRNIETTLNVYGHLLEDAESDKVKMPGMIEAMRPKTCGESVARTL